MRRASVTLACLALGLSAACTREPEPAIEAAACAVDATADAAIDGTVAIDVMTDDTLPSPDVMIDAPPDVAPVDTPAAPLDECADGPQRTSIADVPTAMGAHYTYPPRAIPLPSGRVLLASGDAWSFATWDPNTDTWTSIAKPPFDLKYSLAPGMVAWLHDEVILAAGGYGCPPKSCHGTRVAATYDGKTDTWTPRADLPFDLVHTTTVMQVGVDDVMVQGASGGWFRYDVAKDSWSKVALVDRVRSSVTTLDDGRVLIAGGYGTGDVMTALVEIFDPKTGAVVTAAPMLSARYEHVSVRLRDGRVLVAGGLAHVDGASTREAEIYDPKTNVWKRVAAMPRAHTSQSAALLPCGGVLVIGGDELGLLWPPSGTATPPPRHPIDEAYVYLPSLDEWKTLPLPIARSRAAITRLDDGRILVVGGEESDEAATTADLWR